MTISSTLKFIATHPLNHQQKALSVWRFAKWQIASRLAPGAIVFDWVNGSRFMVRKGETGLTGNVYTGLHEFPDMAYLLHVLRPEDLFVDVGANVGSYTILACSAVGAKGYAFEPIPSTHSRLVENLRLNCLEQTVRHPNVGIGDQSGELLFTTDGDTINHALAEGELCANTVSVEVATLDAVLMDDSPSLIKIDVEGFEKPVLLGAQSVLSNTSLHSVIMELNGSGERYGFDESTILEMMFDHGFRAYSYQPFQRTLHDLNGKNLDLGNTLFIRNREYVEGRIRSADKITVNGCAF